MKLRFPLLTFLALVGCLNGSLPGDPSSSTTDQEVQSCSASCSQSPYNGVPVACASNFSCLSLPDEVQCLADDGVTVNSVHCSSGPVCGDGVCSASETTNGCPADCQCPLGQLKCCGDGECYPRNLCFSQGFCAP